MITKNQLKFTLSALLFTIFNTSLAFTPQIPLHQRPPTKFTGTRAGRLQPQLITTSSIRTRTVFPLKSPLYSTSEPLSPYFETPSVEASETDDAEPSPFSICPVTPLLSTATLIVIDLAFKRLFKTLNLTSKFPSALAACLTLLASFFAFDKLTPEDSKYPSSDGGGKETLFFHYFNPGAGLLAKWLALFFVPSLVTLPLIPKPPTSDLVKLALILPFGFLFSLFSTAALVTGVKKLKSGKSTKEPTSSTSLPPPPPPSDPTPPPPPYSKSTLKNLFRVSKTSFALSYVLTRGFVKFPVPPALLNLLQSAFYLSITLSTFVFGALMKPSVTKVLHPLVTCMTLTNLAVLVRGKLITGLPYVQELGTYTMKSMSPWTFGAGDVLLFLLGPAVVSLSISMFQKRQLVKENFEEVVVGSVSSSILGLMGTSFLARAVGIKPELGISLAPRCITTPLAIAVSSMLGGQPSITAGAVVVTGLLGANFGATLLTKFGVKDPVTRGLSVGSASHGLGTAAIKDEKDAFPFSAIAMAAVGTLTTVFAGLGKKIIKAIVFS